MHLKQHTTHICINIFMKNKYVTKQKKLARRMALTSLQISLLSDLMEGSCIHQCVSASNPCNMLFGLKGVF